MTDVPMVRHGNDPELHEYRCLVFAEDPAWVLATREPGGYCLPRVQVPAHTRAAQQIQSAILTHWNLEVFLLDLWPASRRESPCAIARVLARKPAQPLELIALESLSITDLSAEEHRRIAALIAGRSANPLVRLDWLDEAVRWIESTTGARFSNIARITQWNAGYGFTLLRITSDDRRAYWLKATGYPNAHEFGVTRMLAEICPSSLPRMLGARIDWNAWLSEDAGTSLGAHPSAEELLRSTECVANLQIGTIPHTEELLALGACDQRIPFLQRQIDAVISWLIDAMARQRSTTVPALTRARLLELGDVLRESCDRLEALALPNTILHNDLNPGNILTTGTSCVLIDWSEAAIGNPFLGCARLCQLNRAHARTVQTAYISRWAGRLDSRHAEEAVKLAPLVAIYAYLYGRGDWLSGVEKRQPEFESYARSLARHMDRAAQELSFPEARCR